MKQKKKLRLKDKITIQIRKRKSLKWQSGVVICVLLLGILLIMAQIEHISKKESDTEFNSKNVRVRMTFTGNIQISDSIRQLANEVGYTELFEEMSDYWASSKYVVANVSGPVLRYDVSHYTSTREKDEISNYVRPAALRGILESGINLPSFANDDTYNYGITGIKSTIGMLDEYQADYIGILPSTEEQLYKTIDFSIKNEDGQHENHSIALLSVNDVVRKKSTVGENKAGIINSSLSNIYEQIYKASEENDFVIVYIHFSDSEESAVTENHELAYSLIDAGADMVVGNANILRNLEVYNDGIIAYGLGSFISDELYSISRDSALLDFVINDDGKVNVYVTPVRIESGIPQITNNALYVKRILNILTEGLSEYDYEITEEGMVNISLGQVPEKASDEGVAVWEEDEL